MPVSPRLLRAPLVVAAAGALAAATLGAPAAAGTLVECQSVVVDRAVADVTGTAATLDLEVEAATGSGLTRGDLVLVHHDPLTGRTWSRRADILPRHRIGGDASQGTYRVELTIPRGAPAGDYDVSVEAIRASDGGRWGTGPAEPASRCTTALTVVDRAVDTVAPVLGTPTTAPNAVQATGGLVTLTVPVGDSTSGLAELQAVLTSVSGQSTVVRGWAGDGVVNRFVDTDDPGWQTRDGAVAAGVWRVTVPITARTEAGTWRVELTAVDGAGNTLVVPGQSFTVANPTPMPAAAPAVLSADATDGRVLLFWEHSTDNGGAPRTAYRVSVEPGGHAVTIGAGERTAVVGGLLNGTSYSAAVRAVTAAGDGAAATLAGLVPTVAPGAPTGLRVTPGETSVRVDWSPPPAPGQRAVDHYLVTVSDGVRAFSPARDVPGNSGSAVVTGLTTGTAYTVTVSASNGQVGPAAVLRGVVPATPPPFTPPAVTPNPPPPVGSPPPVVPTEAPPVAPPPAVVPTEAPPPPAVDAEIPPPAVVENPVPAPPVEPPPAAAPPAAPPAVAPPAPRPPAAPGPTPAAGKAPAPVAKKAPAPKAKPAAKPAPKPQAPTARVDTRRRTLAVDVDARHSGKRAVVRLRVGKNWTTLGSVTLNRAGGATVKLSAARAKAVRKGAVVQLVSGRTVLGSMPVR